MLIGKPDASVHDLQSSNLPERRHCSCTTDAKTEGPRNPAWHGLADCRAKLPSITPGCCLIHAKFIHSLSEPVT